jgi:23S rRNA (uracil1939-C5)-methyltransferase
MPSVELEVTVSTLAYGGNAVGRLADGRAVFVPFALPGEKLRIQLIEQKERFARGRVLEVLEASRRRIQPRCRHFTTCGGCHYQHIDYMEQLSIKAEVLRDQLIRIGRLVDPPVAPAIGSPSHWNYRNHVQFHVTAEGRLGFVGAPDGSAQPRIFPIQECHLPAVGLNALWPQIGLDADAGIERVAVRSGSEDDLMLIFESSLPQVPDVEVEASVSIAHIFEGDVLIQVGEDHLQMQVLGRSFRVSPTTFFQVNFAVAEKMVEYLLEILPKPCGTVIDAYCGAGLFSAFLAPRCTRLIGIEARGSACEDFTANLDEFENVELYEDTAEHVLPALMLNPDFVLVDPPRAGVSHSALDALIRMSPPLVAYVSCDPATLARDARRFVEAGYKLESVRPFDMFPQTYHIESISVFMK